MHLADVVEHGEVVNWDHMDALLSHIFGELRVPSLSETPVTLLMQPGVPAKERRLYSELMFENYEAERLLFASTSFSTLCAHGSYSGVVCDSGDSLTSSLAYVNGIPLEESLFSLNIGGRDATQELCKLLRLTGYVFETSVNESVEV